MALFLCLLLAQDAQPYSNASHAFRITPPTGWTVDDRPENSRVVTFNYAKDGDRAEMNCFDVRLKDPATLKVFRSEMESFFKERYKEYKFVVEEKSLFIIQCVDKEGKEVELVKWVQPISLRHLYVVDGAYLKARRETMYPIVKKAIDSFTLLPSEPPKDSKQLEATAATLRKISDKVDYTQTLDILVAGQRFGSYGLSFKSAEVDGRQGYSFSSSLDLDAKEGGKTKTTARGFVSTDFGYETIEIEENTQTNTGRALKFKASARLDGTQMEGTCWVNEEQVPVKCAVPAGTIFADALELLQYVVLDRGKATYGARTIAPYDTETVPTTIETSDRQKATFESVERRLYFMFVTKSGDTLQTYTYAEDKSILQVKSPKQPIEIKARK